MGVLADTAGNSHEELTGPISKGSQQCKFVAALHHGCEAFIRIFSAMQVLPKLAAFFSRRLEVSQKRGVVVPINPNSYSSSLQPSKRYSSYFPVQNASNCKGNLSVHKFCGNMIIGHCLPCTMM